MRSRCSCDVYAESVKSCAVSTIVSSAFCSFPSVLGPTSVIRVVSTRSCRREASNLSAGHNSHKITIRFQDMTQASVHGAQLHQKTKDSRVFHNCRVFCPARASQNSYSFVKVAPNTPLCTNVSKAFLNGDSVALRHSQSALVKRR